MAKNPKCSFCGRLYTEVVLLIKGQTGNICTGCVTICVNMMNDALTKSSPVSLVRCTWEINTSQEALDQWLANKAVPVDTAQLP